MLVKVRSFVHISLQLSYDTPAPPKPIVKLGGKLIAVDAFCDYYDSNNCRHVIDIALYVRVYARDSQC